MTLKSIARPCLRFCVVAIAVGTAACSNSPSAPTAAPSHSAAPPLTALTNAVVAPGNLAQCFGGSGAASCFGAARLHQTSVTGGSITSAPVFNNGQAVLNSGPTVALVWTAPASGTATSYIVEASSTPGGPANLANFDTGNASTTLTVPNVPSGTYYVRIKANDAGGASAPSNEVQVVVTGAPPAPLPGAASCPSAPRELAIASQNGGTLTLAWLAPSTGVPASYVIQAGGAPNGFELANFDTNSTALTFTTTNVPAGSYYIRVYGRNNSCASPSSLGPSSNEVLLTVGAAASGWGGQIVCHIGVTGPGGYFHDETQTWIVGGAAQVSGPRAFYPTQWTAQGSGGGTGNSWTINSTAATDFTVTTVASTGIPIFDRTTDGILIRRGIVGTTTSFDLREIDFPTFAASSRTATSVTGTYSRATIGGDSPQQPANSNGTLSCNWSLTLR